MILLHCWTLTVTEWSTGLLKTRMKGSRLASSKDTTALSRISSQAPVANQLVVCVSKPLQVFIAVVMVVVGVTFVCR